jgi:uncharacterized membrane protein YjgN (DUF898 family)
MNQWHYAYNGQQHGPVSAQEIRRLQASGMLNTLSLVWSAQLTDWTPLGSIPAEILPITPAGEPLSAYSPPAVSSVLEPAREMPFEFRGKASEYFRIWIVNVVLTVITLGIYAAWAKVRTRRYFYGNTLLDGKPFDFTGNPVAILKGNLIFGGLFILYTVSTAMFPPVAILVLLVIMGLMPWMIQKALRFRAHNTIHRNVRFSFKGQVGEAYGIFLALAFLLPFTLGFILPYMQFRQKKYLLGNMSWGSAEADMQGGAGFFYKTFFKLLGMIFLIAILSSMAVPVFNKFIGEADKAKTKGQSAAVIGNPLRDLPVMGQVAAQDEFKKEFEKAIDEQIAANPEMSESEKEALLKSKEQVAEVMQMMMFIIIPIYLFMFLGFLYYQVRTTNYCLNSTVWKDVGCLESRIRTRDLIWIYISNGFAILLSFGLLIPWVLVRMARYRTSRTVLHARPGSLDSVAQASGSSDSAIGDAGADIFDFEIGF